MSMDEDFEPEAPVGEETGDDEVARGDLAVHAELHSPFEVEELPSQEPEDDVASKNHPDGLGKRYRDLSAEERPVVMADLREFVYWLTSTWELDKNVIPPCWYRHAELVEELYAMRISEQNAYETGNPNPAPGFSLMPYIAAMISRIRTQSAHWNRCVMDKAHSAGAWQPLAYDESDWASWLTQRSDTQEIPDEADRYARVNVEELSDGGELVEVPVGEIPVAGTVVPVRRLVALETLTSGPEGRKVRARIEGEDVTVSSWAVADTPEGEWEVLVTSREDPAGGDETAEDGPFGTDDDYEMTKGA